MQETQLKVFIDKNCGGVKAVADKTNLTSRAVYKWATKGSLPRTEFSDETKYAEDLSDLSGFSASEIKEMFKPQPQLEEA
ncbi:hypothetical protein H0262_05585 [Psychrobacter cryohalolentis]|uniref:hypothetical protein n=1 Tax=Psychrobacter sp. D2 TaxID=2759702 RepID=UPI0015E5F39E|nr:hypothetical protein [Psychrobacter sp. D2]MBA2057353.1 hypothetical protein [Psychrobacter sp. D2]